MKHQEFIVLGLAGLALWMIVKGGGKAPAASGPATGYRSTKEVFNTNGTQFDNGWRYYTDGAHGYGIDPSGAYYMDGQKIWAPA